MKSSNPVLSRSGGFNGRTATAASGVTYPAYGSPPQSDPYGRTVGPLVDEGRMTIDSVVQRTAMVLGLIVLTAAATWVFVGDIAASDANYARAGGLATGGAIIGFGLAMFTSFKKVISPGLVLAYAAVEGVFVGAFSKIVAGWVGDPAIVTQAVIGTFVAFAGTLTVYKVFDIKVTDKFRRGFTAVLFGFVGLLLVNFVLSFFNADFGLRNMGGLGLLISVVAVVLAVVMLILDFDFIERGIEAGLPERESWRAAFGLAVTLVWLYIELLRILAILRGQD